jgi:hypothetical protein
VPALVDYYYSLDFLRRLTVLLALGIGVVSIDAIRHGRNATKWREYSLLLLVGIAFGLGGAVNDSITVSISPDYFVFGKQLPPETLPSAAILLGFKAGMVAGLIVGGLLLTYVSSRTDIRGRLKAVVSVLPEVAGFALLGALTLGALVRVTSQVYIPFRLVQGLHAGLYLGLALGTLRALLLLNRNSSTHRA